MNWLRTRREQAGIATQEELSRRLQLEGINVTRGAVTHWENGKRGMPLDDPDFRLALGRILRMTEMEILVEAGYGLSVKNSGAAQRAASIIEQLPPEKQELAVRILEQFLAEPG